MGSKKKKKKKLWKNDTKALEQVGISDQRDVYDQVKQMKDLLNTARSDLRGRTTPLKPAFKDLQLAVLKAHKVLDGLKKVRTFNAKTKDTIAAQIARLELLAAATQDQTLPPTEVLNNPGLVYDLEDPWPDHVTTTEDVDIDALVQRHRDRRRVSRRRQRPKDRRVKAAQIARLELLAAATQDQTLPPTEALNDPGLFYDLEDPWPDHVTTTEDVDIDALIQRHRGRRRVSRRRQRPKDRRVKAVLRKGRLHKGGRRRQRPKDRLVKAILRKGRRRRRARKAWGRLVEKVVAHQNIVDILAKGKQRRKTKWIRSIAQDKLRAAAESEAESEEDSSSSEAEDQDPLRADMLGIGREPVAKPEYEETWENLLRKQMAERRTKIFRAGKSPIAKKE